MATLTVNVTTDFTGQNFNPVIDVIEFTNTKLTEAFATFTASQFDDVNISTTLTVNGNIGFNRIVINDANGFDATGWTFANWSASDFIAINGTSGGDHLDGSTQNDTINGNEGDDTINGNGGNDKIRGEAGADTLHGGAGEDDFLYLAGDVAATEIINGGGGTDEILVGDDGNFDFRTSNITSVEALRYANATSFVTLSDGQIGGPGGIVSVTGNINDDALSIIGTAVDLSGVTFTNWTAGADLINVTGTAGDDTIIGSYQDDQLFGQEGNDTLQGGLGDDVLSGSFQDDVIIGGAGANSLNGGTGIDTLSYVGSAAVIVDLAANTTSGGDAEGDDILLFENVIGGNGGDTLTGNAAANVLNGRGGADVLTGGLAADTLIGGGGGDVFKYVSFIEIQAGESIDGGGGSGDRIEVASNTAGAINLDDVTIAGVEKLDFILAGIVALAGNQIGAAAGLIHEVSGSSGIDRLEIAGAAVDLTGVAFTDWTAGDTIGINGDGGGNILTGSNKSEFITGGGAKDTLTGGGSGDFFVFSALADSTTGAQRDVITDFNNGSDKMFLAGMDADTSSGGDDAFSFIGKAAFSGTAGELRAVKNSGSNITLVSGDVDGDGAADFQIELTGLVTLAAGDFFL